MVTRQSKGSLRTDWSLRRQRALLKETPAPLKLDLSAVCFQLGPLRGNFSLWRTQVFVYFCRPTFLPACS